MPVLQGLRHVLGIHAQTSFTDWPCHRQRFVIVRCFIDMVAKFKLGVVVGAANLLDNFRIILEERLTDVGQEYLEKARSKLLQDILDEAVEDFHLMIKAFPAVPDCSEPEEVIVSSLKEDSERGFVDSAVQISR
jgi:hypothetical protein